MQPDISYNHIKRNCMEEKVMVVDRKKVMVLSIILVKWSSTLFQYLRITNTVTIYKTQT